MYKFKLPMLPPEAEKVGKERIYQNKRLFDLVRGS